MLISNDDDHLRNHAIVHGLSGWNLSPAYDLVPHPQQSHTRQLGLGIGKRGRIASYENALSEAARFGLNVQEAEQVALEVLDGVYAWDQILRESGVSEVDVTAVRSAFLPESVTTGFPRRSLNGEARGSHSTSFPRRIDDDDVARELRQIHQEFESAATIIEQAGIQGTNAFGRLRDLEQARERLDPLRVQPMPQKPEGSRFSKLEPLRATPELLESLGASPQLWRELAVKLSDAEQDLDKLPLQSSASRSILKQIETSGVGPSELRTVRKALSTLERIGPLLEKLNA